MPSRILREGIIDSAAVNAVSEPAEILYRRLMSVVDDYGRFDANADLIRARCFPLQLDRWSTARIVECLTELRLEPEDHDLSPLVTVYSCGPKKYLQINNFGQRVQAKPKFPGPEDGVIERVRSDVPLKPTVTNGEPPPRATRAQSESESESKADAQSGSQPASVRVFPPPRKHASDLDGKISGRFTEFWEKYPMQVERDAAARMFMSVVTVDIEDEVFACLDRYLASDQVFRGVVAKAANWINQQHRDNWQSQWPPAKSRDSPTSSKPKDAILSSFESYTDPEWMRS